MCMSLSRRFQILLDEQQYRRISAEAAARGVSVAQVIRDAIDRGIGGSPTDRAAALRRVLAADPMPVPDDPADLRSELDGIRGERFA
jgi:hypothetical protein